MSLILKQQNEILKLSPPPKESICIKYKFKLERTISIGFLRTTLTSVSFL